MRGNARQQVKICSIKRDFFMVVLHHPGIQSPGSLLGLSSLFGGVSDAFRKETKRYFKKSILNLQ
jgi:hypothetical protein